MLELRCLGLSLDAGIWSLVCLCIPQLFDTVLLLAFASLAGLKPGVVGVEICLVGLCSRCLPLEELSGTQSHCRRCTAAQGMRTCAVWCYSITSDLGKGKDVDFCIFSST